MDGQSDWRVPIKLIDVKSSLASFYRGKLEVNTRSFPRSLDDYCIISYVWSHEESDKFEVDEICGLTRIGRTITSCSQISFVAMLDICDQVSMKHVWIDCVCVEQENNNLKSLQLAEMGYYYSRAAICLVFLNGLNIYTPPIFEEGNLRSWYDRVWTVQEAAYTFNKKAFVHALPCITLLESSDLITSLTIRAEHVDLISKCLTHNKYQGSVSEWFLGLVYEWNYPDFWRLIGSLGSAVRFSQYDWLKKKIVRPKSMLSLDLKDTSVSQVIREVLRGTRGCRYPQDRVYSIMTLLGIELDVSYSRSLRDTILKAAETMSPEKLVHFVTATWYSQNGHALPEVAPYIGGESLVLDVSSQSVMDISECITDVKVEGSDLLITTKTKPVNISRLVADGFSSSDADLWSNYMTHGYAFLLNGDVKVRGDVNFFSNEEMHLSSGITRDCSPYESPVLEAQLLFMGKSAMRGFDIDLGYVDSDEVWVNVCLVVRQVDAVCIKVGVLYVPQDFSFKPDSEQHFALKL